MARPVTNSGLEALLREADYQNAHATFARQVNHAGRAYGSWRYDAASVYWWLRGRRPAKDVQAVMVEVLARRIGRPVDRDQLGFTEAGPCADAAYPASVTQAIEAAQRLWAMLAKQPGGRAGKAFQAGAALQSALSWRYDTPDRTVNRSGRDAVTRADVQALYVLADRFTDLDRRHGGGSRSARPLLADLLVRQVTPMLHGTYCDAVGRDLMRAAAVLAGQLAFMSYDAGDQGFAQHQITLALRLAKAADDRLFGAHLLANLATQAIYLGHADDAVRMAQAAIDGAGRAPAAVKVRLYATVASAYGRSGEKRSCRAALAKAERAVDQAPAEDVPSWAGYFSPAHLAGATVRCLSDLGLHREALRDAPGALALATANIRTRVLHTALVATTHAHAGDLDTACEWGNRLVDLAPSVHSVRVTSRIRELASKLADHQNNNRVHELLQNLPTQSPSA
ncbi:hypothetical protein [Micromonospora yangpuensis]|uniref:Transcriptional regulator n=1 Tax=Micromonospora yangpuensis TaxID=683228 RepID=A0A1C6UA96_9ACTN|nr:hypothetical protein [Micromonospora yangpuensis]GGL87861.1 hypothetical protein GCM10012279_01910 [Micromonospora yangpuensis]SCL50888.1 hypothetical protein GA0070617_1625 [Micromonospora yangpuensis]